MLIICFVPLCGYTSCKYFSTTTVPATDSTPPIAAPSLIVNGDQRISFSPIVETFSDEDTLLIPIASIYDSGGARTLQMTSSMRIRCHSGSLGQITFVDFFPQSDSQSGTTGSSVSNGLWLMQPFYFRDYVGYCNSGFTLTEIQYSWGFSGTNFHGGSVSSAGGTLTYVP